MNDTLLFGLSGALLIGLLALIIILWIMLPVLVMGTNRRLETIAEMIKLLNNNMIDNHEKTLEAQKDILVCLQKMYRKPDADATKK